MTNKRMPELPEVETIARKLCSQTCGRTITDVSVHWARTVDRPDVATFKADLTGARVEGVARRGKFLALSLDTGETLMVHLRMSGRFTTRELGEAPHKHVRVSLALDNETWLDFINPRKFGRVYLVQDAEEIAARLGPEPLDPVFTPQRFYERLRGRRGEIKRLLLDQHFIAGLGNIYVSEALWQARIHPQRAGGSLTEAEAYALHRAIVNVLSTAIRNGGTSLEDRQYVYPDGGTGEHQRHLNVYDRKGEACRRCGYVLQRIVQGQRSTYLCPVCQTAPTALEETDEMETTKLKIEGMSCQMCVKHVTRALEGVAGVTEVDVSLDAGTATVTYDPAKADLDAFTAAVAEADYTVAGVA